MDEASPLTSGDDDLPARAVRKKPVATEYIELRNCSVDTSYHPHVFDGIGSAAYIPIDKQGYSPVVSNDWINRLWIREIVSLVFATIALTAIVIT